MEEIDLKEVIVALWNKKLFVIITTILFALMAFLIFGICTINDVIKYNQNPETLYYAETHFVVETPKISQTESISNSSTSISIIQENEAALSTTQIDRLSQTYSELIKSRTALNKIINELELDISVNNLSNLISFSCVPDSDFLSILVAYKDKEKAIQIVNKLTEEFAKNIEKVYSDKVTVIDEAFLLTDDDLTKSSTVVNIITPSSIVNTSIKKTIKYITIFTFLGFIASIGIVLFIEMFDDTINNEEYLKEISVLTKIDKNIKDNQNKFAILRIQLSKFKTLLVTSADNYTDTTYISNNLAVSYANANKKVLLIDLNSNESELLKKYNGKGLLDYINSKNKDIEKFISKSTVNNLDILLIGNNTNYIDESDLQETITSLQNKYDAIIINSKDILNEPNTLATLKIAKNSILVATEKKTKITEFDKAQTVMKEISENVVGNILLR